MPVSKPFAVPSWAFLPVLVGMLGLVGITLMAPILPAQSLAAQSPAALGQFDRAVDIGAVQIPGESRFHEETGSYRLTGSGENMWFATDAFHFLSKKVSGDVRIAADVLFDGEGKNAHRKAVLMFRQSLDPDAAYVDVAVHGDGLTSMQFRGGKGAQTHELQFGKPAPRRVELLREGNLVSVRLDGEEMRLGERAIKMENFLRGEFYVGLGVCSHEAAVAETAVFTRVELDSRPANR